MFYVVQFFNTNSKKTELLSFKQMVFPLIHLILLLLLFLLLLLVVVLVLVLVLKYVRAGCECDASRNNEDKKIT